MNNDLISREALKKAIEDLYDDTRDGIVKFGIEKAMGLIDNAPTIKTFTLLDIEENFKKGLNIGLSYAPEDRPQGKWIFSRCDKCGAYHDGMYRNFCPNCGADMREESEK